MEKVGIIKEFDKLGRLVIPKNMRDRYGITDKAEIVTTEEGILVKSPEYILIKTSQIREEQSQTT